MASDVPTDAAQRLQATDRETCAAVWDSRADSSPVTPASSGRARPAISAAGARAGGAAAGAKLP